MDSTNITISKCPYCSNEFTDIYHYGGRCPEIKAIEYYPTGQIKRVEFLTPGDKLHPLKAPDWDNPIITWGAGIDGSNTDYNGWIIIGAS